MKKLAWLSFGFLLCAVCCVLCAGAVSAEVPKLIRYQGQATDTQGVPLEGNYRMTFRLYDAATAGTILWEEIQDPVSLSKGYFSTLLGQVTSLGALDWSQPRWFGVQVNGEAELAPRQQITSVPLAIRADTAERMGPIAVVGPNVGIGTTAPASQRGFGPADRIVHIKGASASGIRMDGPNGASTEIYSGGNGELYVDVYGASTAANNAILFQTEDANGATTPSERMRITSAGNVGIGVSNPANILTIQQGSATDPIADAWTTYACDRKHKDLLRTNPTGYLARIKEMSVYEWRRKVKVSDEEALAAVGKQRPSPAELDAKKQELATVKATLPKYTAKRLGPAIDDANVPPEILVLDPDGTPAGIDLLAYVGYLHAALREAALKIDELEARLNTR